MHSLHSEQRTRGRFHRSALAAFGMVASCGLCVPSILAQDVHPVSAGSVRSVQSGVIARTTGGERVGGGAFGTSESAAHVVSGKVAGYGARPRVGSLPEYGAQGSGGTDFVATMPKPAPIAYGAYTSDSGAGGLGITLSSPPAHGSAIGAGSHKAAHHTIRDPEAILNPFTHTIGSSLGSPLSGHGSMKETVLGAPKLP